MNVFPLRRHGKHGERTPLDAASEEDELIALAPWLKQHRLVWTRHTGPRLGVMLMIYNPPPKLRGITTGLLLNLTRRGAPMDRITADILYWHDRFAALGWRTAVAFGAVDAIHELEDLGYGRAIVQ